MNTIKDIPDKTFDCILSFESIQYEKEPLLALQEYHRLLKNDGMLIISTANKDIFSLYDRNNNGPPTELSKKDFVKIIKKFFPKCVLYSQRNLSNIELHKPSGTINYIVNMIRNISIKILRTLDKNSNFYKLHLQKTVLKLRDTKELITKKILNISYDPIPHEESHSPLFLLSVCTK
jgi:SAM-dependent methyltransferase